MATIPAIAPSIESGEHTSIHHSADIVPATTTAFEQDIEAPSDAATAFPDGGLHAWLVVLGAFCSLTITFGVMTSVGVLQAYWKQNQLAAYTESEIGWIPSVFVFLALLLGVQFGPLFDRYGPAWILRIASIGYVVCLVLLAECSTYWQFMLTLGVLGGVCCAALSTVALAALSHWFRLRRGLANGLAMAGSSCGGITFPLMLRPALDDLGWVWSMRLMALAVGALGFAASVLIRGRLPLGRASGAVDLRCLKDVRLACISVGTFCASDALSRRARGKPRTNEWQASSSLCLAR